MRRTIRTGMTLVELLVVITIIGVLGGIVALVAPRFQESTRVGQGTSQFKNWLESARVRAQRDKAPRGIRLIETLPASVPFQQEFYYKFAYVEQPDDITGNPVEIAPPMLPPTSAPFTPYLMALNQLRRLLQTNVVAQLTIEKNAAAAAGNTALQTTLANYQAKISPALNPANNFGWQYLLFLKGRNLSGTAKGGDVVEFGGARYTLVIDPVVPPSQPDSSILVLHRPRDEYRDFKASGNTLIRNTMNSPLPSYRITRSPRPIAGEPELTLPANVAIDFIYPTPTNQATRTMPVPQAGGTGSFDVMFSPSGELTGGLGAYGRLIFWLRDVSLSDPGAGQLPPGDNRLVVLHCRTGQVSTHPVDPTLGTMGTLTDPYSFVRDGKSSNLKDE